MLQRLFIICLMALGGQCISKLTCTYPGHGVHSWTSLDVENTMTFLPGTRVNYYCDPGFEILSNFTRICMDDGRWAFNEPLCAVNVAYGRNVTDVSSRVAVDSYEKVHNLLDNYFGTCYDVKTMRLEDEVAWEINLLEYQYIDAVRVIVEGDVQEFRFGVSFLSNETESWTELPSGMLRPVSTYKVFVGNNMKTAFEVYTDYPVYARYLRIHKYPDRNNGFTLCELSVYSKTAIAPQQCKSQARNSSLVAVHEATCFTFNREKDLKKNWNGAKEECESKGSYLATKIGESRQNFLQMTLLNAYSSRQVIKPDHFWIAGKATKANKGYPNNQLIWKWPDGRAIEELLWGMAIDPRAFPNKPMDREELCLVLAEDLNWLWGADSCNTEKSYICQHKVRSCGTPEQKPNTWMKVFQTNYGTYMAAYNCSKGFYLSGMRTRMCMNTVGQWDGEAPACLYVNCGYPKNFTGLQYQLLDGTTTYGSRLKYTCSDSSLEVVNGSQYWVCEAGQQWHGNAPVCGFSEFSAYTNAEVGMWVLYIGIAIIVILLVFMAVLIGICIRKQKRKAEFTVKHTKIEENASSRDHLDTKEQYTEQGAANYGAAQTKH